MAAPMTVSPMAEVMMWAALVLALLLAVGWFLSYTAVRLDRLHHRIFATAAALDAQLVRRAEATLEVALGGGLDPASSTLLAGAATEALDTPGPWSIPRQRAESGLTEVLRMAGPSLDQAGPPVAEDEVVARLRGAALRVQLARRFHNEAICDAVRLRARVPVRLFRLAGHAAMPEPVSFDDDWPEGHVD
jgi:hypothetical protein